MALKDRRLSVSKLQALVGDIAVEAGKKALSECADEIVADAKSRCPVKTGALRDSIHKEVKKNGERVTVGTRLKSAPSKKYPNGVNYGKIVEFSPRINKPFLYPALDAHRAQTKEKIRQAIAEAVKHGKSDS
ncbi:HK97-gp10 family putative phage morphogenesis protein [Selenomonas ruminantium]|uniref:HK97-gp10 family putative phage morphogenesis protein n=1 Tax=Selenomonas ruminantium TaxID=971 RepID=UPI0005A4FF6B|nr:HK97-gp10 family putative phage morphogenesis protein [Selenomonas ruminantium]